MNISNTMQLLLTNSAPCSHMWLRVRAATRVTLTELKYYPWSSASWPWRAAAVTDPPSVQNSSCFPVSCWTLEINSGLISSECFELISVQLHSSPAAACDSWSCDSESVPLPADGTHSAESQRTESQGEEEETFSCSHSHIRLTLTKLLLQVEKLHSVDLNAYLCRPTVSMCHPTIRDILQTCSRTSSDTNRTIDVLVSLWTWCHRCRY